MKEIHATDMGRTSDGYVLIQFTDETGNDLLSGGRNYPAAAYDADPQAVIAAFASEYTAKAIPVVQLPPASSKPVVMTLADVAVKQAAMVNVKVVPLPEPVEAAQPEPLSATPNDVLSSKGL